MDKEELNKITERIISAAYKVTNTLGAGFLEKVYENALMIELKNHDLKPKQQEPIKVMYDGVIVGDYLADIIVENEIILELKSGKAIEDIHLAQTLNYLKASGLKLGLILNFGKPKIEIKRVVNNL